MKINLKGKGLFIFLGAILVGLVVAYIFFQTRTLLIKQAIKNDQIELQAQEESLQQAKYDSGYQKLVAIRQLEKQYQSIPWGERIENIIDMLQELKSVDSSPSETIVLSDFKVDLDQIMLKGTVSNLLLLYFSDPTKNYLSLIERFSQLDFIKNMRIQRYNKVTNQYYEFILHATVTDEPTEK